jgi:hypothetical protein
MEKPLETKEYKGYTIEIWPDRDPAHPRDDQDNLGTMMCLHNKYNMGDIGGRGRTLRGKFARYPWFKTPREFEDWWANNGHGGIRLPIYMYDHSGRTIRTSPFSCAFDSGMLGFIFATQHDIRSWFNVKRITKDVRKRAESCLEAEVEEYDNYLTEAFIGFVVKKGDEQLESGWGYTVIAEAMVEAEAAVDCIRKAKPEQLCLALSV